MLIQMFVLFFIVGLVSFGGGYAMVPLIQREVVERYQWMDVRHFTDLVAMAGMSPGPIATNIAVFVGYDTAGLTGAVVAAAAVVLPSLLIMIAAGMLLYRIRHHKLVQSSFYGLRAVVTGLIIYAAIMFAGNTGALKGSTYFMWSQALIFAGSLIALMFFRKHPVSIMIISGLIGIALYT
ncbi:chromate transporter [Paenibacillus cisolokensis]|uniref:Chromate transporter n=1 Tax=Paenibacillus cisolokensis TaxID=1658519 RepID=A0ABQ4N8A8_9BACL|nr:MULTISPECIES: chromate transporter [Paenibacillus]ALS28182.1 chromate transporter [Paenibacillus sp. 32O-W]GIQ64435.1 chromate transporter [Paenibacillus cisolokensis]